MDNKSYFTKPGYIAVAISSVPQIETQKVGGFVTIAQYTQLVELPIVMDGQCHNRTVSANKHKALVRGDSLFRPWTKQKLYIDNLEFVLCPESEVVAIIAYE